MSLLVLELRPGEMMVVNGATIRFRSRCRVELVSKARFLFGKQVMVAEQAETATGRLYFALQTAYAGPQDERNDAADAVETMLQTLELQASEDVRPILRTIRADIEKHDFYGALKRLRTMIRQEQAKSPPHTLPA
jgi:flagellar protein FlbT